MRFARTHQLETPRCTLRHVSEDDIPHVFSATRVEGFNDGMQWEPPRDQSELNSPLENNKKAWADDSAYVFTIETHNGDFVGRIAIRSTDSVDIWDLGFWTHPTFQGLGYMSEAVERILIFGFRELGAREIEACHASWNIASKRVLEKCGFTWREHIPQGFQKKGEWVSEERLSVVQSIPQKIHAGTAPGAIVARTADHIAFLDHEPIATGHTLVCPVRKVTSIFDLSDVERIQFLDFAGSIDKRLRETFNPVGISQIMNDGPFNELNHLHLHLIPRYNDDGFSWVTPACRPHTITELEQTAEKIRSEQDATSNGG